MPDKKTILEGHKKVGNKFIPPMMQLPNWSEISYVNLMLPEIIWMGLINDEFGYRDGISLSTNLANRAFELKETDKHINFALVSNFSLLSNEKKIELIKGLEESLEIGRYRHSLLPLIVLYEDFPLSFIGAGEEEYDREQLIEKMKACIDRYIDKYETPAMIIQANLMYIRGTNGGLHVASHIEIPDLNVLIEDPESEAAKRAGGFVRISAMQEFMPMGEDRYGDWSKIFWDQGYKIDKCDFSWDENDFDE
jgi:hypothetical protein